MHLSTVLTAIAFLIALTVDFTEEAAVTGLEENEDKNYEDDNYKYENYKDVLANMEGSQGSGDKSEDAKSKENKLTRETDDLEEETSITDKSVQETSSTIITVSIPVPSTTVKGGTSTTTLPLPDDCDPQNCTQTQITPKFQSVLVGENITLTCSQDGITSGDQQFRWFFNDEEYQIEVGSILFIQGAELDHTGEYTCIAYRRCCESGATARVVVYEKPAYWIHLAVLLGVSLGLLLLCCIPTTVLLHRRYWQMKVFKNKKDSDEQALTS